MRAGRALGRRPDTARPELKDSVVRASQHSASAPYIWPSFSLGPYPRSRPRLRSSTPAVGVCRSEPARCEALGVPGPLDLSELPCRDVAAWMFGHDASGYDEIVPAFVDGGRSMAAHETRRWTHHARVADEHRRLLGSCVLGDRTRLRRREGRHRSGGLKRLPEKDLSGAAQLGGAGVPEPHLFQRGGKGQRIRRLARAGPVHGRGAGRAQGAAVIGRVIVGAT